MSMNPIFRFVVAALLLTGSTAGVLVPSVSEKPAATPPAVVETAPAATEIASADAMEIALRHAGFTQADVTALRVKKETDDRKSHYDVEFSQNGWEYDYEIHAVTGAVLEWDKEYDPPKQKPATPVATEPAPPAKKAQLTRQEALQIALRHAGLTAQQVKKLQSKLEKDDGVLLWEIEFRSGKWEYDYEIHAVTGAVLEWDREVDD